MAQLRSKQWGRVDGEKVSYHLAETLCSTCVLKGSWLIDTRPPYAGLSYSPSPDDIQHLNNFRHLCRRKYSQWPLRIHIDER